MRCTYSYNCKWAQGDCRWTFILHFTFTFRKSAYIHISVFYSWFLTGPQGDCLVPLSAWWMLHLTCPGYLWCNIRNLVDSRLVVPLANDNAIDEENSFGRFTLSSFSSTLIIFIAGERTEWCEDVSSSVESLLWQPSTVSSVLGKSTQPRRIPYQPTNP